MNFIKLFRNWHSAIFLWFNFKKTESILRLRTGEQFKVRSGRPDIQMIIELYIGKSYHTYIDKIKQGSIIIDIGANIGVFSVFAAKKLSGDCRIYSFEPFEDNYRILCDNIMLNSFTDCITSGKMAVTSFDGESILYINEADNTMHSLISEGAKKVSVKTISLSAIFAENNITSCGFLKVDCEGAEYDIFLNTPPEILNKINIISIEYHKVEGHSHNELVSLLKSSGFDVLLNESSTDGYGYIDAHQLSP